MVTDDLPRWGGSLLHVAPDSVPQLTLNDCNDYHEAPMIGQDLRSANHQSPNSSSSRLTPCWRGVSGGRSTTGLPLSSRS
jgi:hypothetical protein